MPSGQSWMYFVYVNLSFIAYICIVYYYGQMTEIKKNWPQYRCNPVYMPLADDIHENFVYCVQTMQSNYMGTLLQPITFVTQTLSSMLGNMSADVNNVRAMFDKVRTFFSTIVQSIFAVFLNMIIEFQRITIGIKDLVGKTVGIMVSLMYVMDGSIKTMNSTWNGPPGQTVRALGKCFYPETLIQLKNGEKKKMCNVNINDILSDGSRIVSTMMLDNTVEPETLYIFQTGQGTKQGTHDTIYVTGSHFVLDETEARFVPVHAHPQATKTKARCSVLCSFITDTHCIPVGNYVFWDWEDHELAKEYYNE